MCRHEDPGLRRPAVRRALARAVDARTARRRRAQRRHVGRRRAEPVELVRGPAAADHEPARLPDAGHRDAVGLPAVPAAPEPAAGSGPRPGQAGPPARSPACSPTHPRPDDAVGEARAAAHRRRPVRAGAVPGGLRGRGPDGRRPGPVHQRGGCRRAVQRHVQRAGHRLHLPARRLVRLDAHRHRGRARSCCAGCSAGSRASCSSSASPCSAAASRSTGPARSRRQIETIELGLLAARRRTGSSWRPPSAPSAPRRRPWGRRATPPSTFVADGMVTVFESLDVVLVAPLAWLAIGAVVLGHKLMEPPSTEHRWLDRMTWIPAGLRSVLESLTEDLRARFSALRNGLKMIVHGGLGPMLVFCLGYLVIMRVPQGVSWLVRAVTGPVESDRRGSPSAPWRPAAGLRPRAGPGGGADRGDRRGAGRARPGGPRGRRRGHRPRYGRSNVTYSGPPKRQPHLRDLRAGIGQHERRDVPLGLLADEALRVRSRAAVGAAQHVRGRLPVPRAVLGHERDLAPRDVRLGSAAKCTRTSYATDPSGIGTGRRSWARAVRPPARRPSPSRRPRAARWCPPAPARRAPGRSTRPRGAPARPRRPAPPRGAAPRATRTPTPGTKTPPRPPLSRSEAAPARRRCAATSPCAAGHRGVGRDHPGQHARAQARRRARRRPVARSLTRARHRRGHQSRHPSLPPVLAGAYPGSSVVTVSFASHSCRPRSPRYPGRPRRRRRAADPRAPPSGRPARAAPSPPPARRFGTSKQ